MAAVNAMERIFDEWEFFGKPALFTCLRVDRKTIPEGLYAYDLREEDDGYGDPCQVQKFVLVNHYGTVILAEPLDLGEEGRRDVELDDWTSVGGDQGTTIEWFMKKYCEK